MQREVVVEQTPHDVTVEHDSHGAPHDVIVEHGPAHAVGHAKFTYVHYPSAGVFCDKQRKLWFWLEGGQWKHGAVLPARFHVVASEAVNVELDSDTPYVDASHGNGKAKGKKD